MEGGYGKEDTRMSKQKEKKNMHVDTSPMLERSTLISFPHIHMMIVGNRKVSIQTIQS